MTFKCVFFSVAALTFVLINLATAQLPGSHVRHERQTRNCSWNEVGVTSCWPAAGALPMRCSIGYVCDTARNLCCAPPQSQSQSQATTSIPPAYPICPDKKTPAMSSCFFGSCSLLSNDVVCTDGYVCCPKSSAAANGAAGTAKPATAKATEFCLVITLDGLPAKSSAALKLEPADNLKTIGFKSTRGLVVNGLDRLIKAGSLSDPKYEYKLDYCKFDVVTTDGTDVKAFMKLSIKAQKTDILTELNNAADSLDPAPFDDYTVTKLDITAKTLCRGCIPIQTRKLKGGRK